MMVHHVPRLNNDGEKKDHRQQQSDMYATFLHEKEENKNSAHLFDHKKMASLVSTINDTKLAKKVQ